MTPRGAGGRRRLRTMPAVAAEVLFSRPFWWAALVVCALVGVFLVVAAIDAAVGRAPWGAGWTVVLAVVCVTWWVVIVTAFDSVLYRPRRAASTVQAVPGPAAVQAPSVPASTAGVEAVPGVRIPGSRRVPGWTLASVLVLIALLIVVAVAASTGWRIVCLVVIVVLAAVAAGFCESLRHPRMLVLTPRGLRAVVFGSDAELAWGDIARIRVVQGANGLMVLRVEAVRGATSFVQHWRHPFLRPRRGSDGVIDRVIDIEPLTLDLDPLLVLLALRLYRLNAASRSELHASVPPRRLFDGRWALATVPAEISAPLAAQFRPR